MYEHDGRTNGSRMTAKAALDANHRAAKTLLHARYHRRE